MTNACWRLTLPSKIAWRRPRRGNSVPGSTSLSSEALLWPPHELLRRRQFCQQQRRRIISKQFGNTERHAKKQRFTLHALICIYDYIYGVLEARTVTDDCLRRRPACKVLPKSKIGTTTLLSMRFELTTYAAVTLSFQQYGGKRKPNSNGYMTSFSRRAFY